MDKKVFSSELIADEIKLYLEHLDLISRNLNEKEGNVTDYSNLSFGKATDAKYKISDDDYINALLNFSTATWEWDDKENPKTVDVDLDAQENRYMYNTIMIFTQCHNNGFIRTIDKDSVNFEEVKNILMEKYGIELVFSYTEKTYAKTYTNGSDNIISRDRAISYIVDSHLFLRGKVKTFEKKSKDNNNFGVQYRCYRYDRS